MSDSILFPAILFITAAILLLLSTSVLVFIAAHRKRVKQKLSFAQAEAKYQQELRTIAKEVQEQILDNFSNELHNNIGQRLTLIHMQLQTCESAANDVSSIVVNADNNLIDVMKQVRQLSHSFSADYFRVQGLTEMVCKEVLRLQHNGRMLIHYMDEKDVEPGDVNLVLSSDQQLVVFRIFQETINNIFKHSDANHIYITLWLKNSFLLEIKDDGKGFDIEAATNSKGLGLLHMHKRADMAGLQCIISSSPGKGSIYKVCMD